ncbi:unnamed protein product [Prorocentrum cordatum]|uniref:Uncharacterized protein n=1 Tax=Prorocentrum cordatum TaxID=2364126 RepID=A0ABN9SCM0_9DINO|nr:unnamed protein product [Polarella glacialis]
MVSVKASTAVGRATDPVSATIKALENAVRAVPLTCKAQVEITFRPETDALERRLQAQLDTFPAKVEAIGGRTCNIAAELANARSSIDEMRLELQHAHSLLPRPKPPSASFHREVDGIIFKIVPPTTVKKANVASLNDELFKDVKIDVHQLAGEHIGRTFIAQLIGAAAALPGHLDPLDEIEASTMRVHLVQVEFRERVGAPGPALEGCAVHCAVLATGAAVAANGTAMAQGLALDDTLCGVAGVDRPGDKPTLAPVPAGSPAPPPQPSGKPTKPGSEVVVVLQRVGVTLAASGGFVVYSPAEGVMMAVRPRYLFDELEFRERVGAPGPALEGCAVRCAVLATGAAAAAGGALAPQEGLALDDTLCGVAGVDRPGDKPTLALELTGSPAPPPELERLEDALPLEQHES